MGAKVVLIDGHVELADTRIIRIALDWNWPSAGAEEIKLAPTG